MDIIKILQVEDDADDREFFREAVIDSGIDAKGKDIDETYRAGANMFISKIAFYSNSALWLRSLFSYADWRKALMNRTREKYLVAAS